jgi:spoIIIJ-associated protein
LRPTLQDGGFKVNYEIRDVESSDGDVETPDVLVKFSGPDVDLLLTNRAELLLALEHVTMEMLRMPSEDHSRISFDANDYRLLRIEELRLSAMTAAEKVKRTGVPFRFNPMNSRERRVIHLSLRNELAVRSESAGSGPGRQVIVYPAGMASLPELPYTPPPRSSDSRGSDSRGSRRPGGPPRDRRGGSRPPRPR